MRSWGKKITLIILVLAMLIPMLASLAPMPVQANLNTLYERRRHVQRNISETRTYILQTQRDMNQAEREMAELDYKLMNLMDDMIVLFDTLDLVEERLYEAIAELEAARAEHDIQVAIVRERLRDLHEHGPLNILDVLISSSSVRDFMMRMEFMVRVTRHDQDMLDRLEDAELRYIAGVEDVARQRTLLQNTMEELAQTRIEYELLHAEWYARFVDLSASLLTFEERQAAYQAQVRTLDEEIAAEHRRREIEAERERQRLAALAAAQFRGELAWPVPGFFHITSGFGMRPNPFNSRVQQMHNGIDISGSGIYGAPVVAAKDGFVTVAATGWNGGLGTMIIIYHGNGMTTVYAHLSRLQVSVDDRVLAGQPIGNVGSSGSSTGPHLHFEVRHSGRRVNPMLYLRGW